MPSKGSKAAARQQQAQQRSRKRRGGTNKGRGQAFDPGPAEARTAVAVTDPDLIEEDVPVKPQAAPAQAAQRPARRSRQRGASSEPLIYRFIGGELKQIGIIAVLMGIILTVLTFILGG